MLRSIRPRERFGDYQLMRQIATGGMAEIFEARREGAHGFTRRVAIKRILPHLRAEPNLVQMFCNEARVQASLSHPNVVEVLDFGEVEGRLFIALEYVDGTTVAGLMKAMFNRRRTVELPVVLYIVNEVLRGLSYLHDARDALDRPLGLVHRDIAPNNVLIGRVGEIKIADFGIIFSRLGARRTAPGELRGKVGYISPEQVRGEAPDARSDLFSLAVMAAEMLTGKALFQGESMPEVLQSLTSGDLSILRTYGVHLPVSVRDVLTRALAMDPAQRYKSAAHFSRDVECLQHSLGVSMGAYSFTEWLADMGLLRLSSTVTPVRRR
jgi:serine/threonine protein kinase